MPPQPPPWYVCQSFTALENEWTMADEPRATYLDRSCDSYVKGNIAGYCQCESGRRTNLVHTGHEQFKCSIACADPSWTSEVLIVSPNGYLLQRPGSFDASPSPSPDADDDADVRRLLDASPSPSPDFDPNAGPWIHPAALAPTSPENLADVMADSNSPFKFFIVDPSTESVQPQHRTAFGFSHGIRHTGSGDRLLLVQTTEPGSSVTEASAEFAGAESEQLCSDECQYAGDVRTTTPPKDIEPLLSVPSTYSQPLHPRAGRVRRRRSQK